MSENSQQSLADLSTQQQHECIGMWVEHIPWNVEDGYFYMGVLAYCNYFGEEAMLIRPDRGGEQHWALFKHVYPLYDLPRAWTPSGHPARQEQEHQEC